MPQPTGHLALVFVLLTGPGVTGASEVALGYEFSCVRFSNGQASC